MSDHHDAAERRDPSSSPRADDARRDQDPRTAAPKSLVDETSEESFPASDPPSWTPTAHPGRPSAQEGEGER